MRTSNTIKKLCMMSAAEVGFRCLSQWRLESDRFRGLRYGRSLPTVDIPDMCFTPAYLREMFNTHLITEDRSHINTFVCSKFPEWMLRARDRAERLCAHRFPILGHGEVETGRKIDWSRDPVGGGQWPRRFWADFDPAGKAEAGDVKVVHELNRHQHLMTLGRAYFYWGNEKHASEALAQMDSWIDQNPPGLSINWQSSLEVGLRALSWLWTLAFISSSPQFIEGRIRPIAASIAEHLSHISRYPSLYSSPNTHLTGEALALFVGGTIFSGSELGAQWRDQGEIILARESQKQILPDGFHSELSTYYHCYTLDFYLIAMALARRTQPRFIDAVSDRVGLMAEALLHASAGDGSIIRFCDDDGGRALVFDEHGYGSVNGLFSTAAICFGDGRFKWRAETFSEHSLWLLGANAYGAFARIPPALPLTEARLFSDAGYFSARTGWSESDTSLIFDCGGLGFIGGGHGHADALSITFSIGDKPVLVDPGTGVYNAAPKWRNYFRSTRAHNTVTVDGEDQVRPAGTFKWRDPFDCRILQHVSLDGRDYIEASHNGYRRLRRPLTHRRRIFRVGSQYWIVADDFQGETAEHRFEHSFHFMPGTTVSISARGRRSSCVGEVSDSKPLLDIGFTCSGSTETAVITGSDDPVHGWYSPQYGEIVPAPVFCASVRAKTPATAITILLAAPHNMRARAVFRAREVQGFAACEINHGDTRDFIVLSPGTTPVDVDEFELEGEFFWIRRTNGKVHELYCANAKRASTGGAVLFESPTVTPWFWRTFEHEDLNRSSQALEGSVYVRH